MSQKLSLEYKLTLWRNRLKTFQIKTNVKGEADLEDWAVLPLEAAGVEQCVRGLSSKQGGHFRLAKPERRVVQTQTPEMTLSETAYTSFKKKKSGIKTLLA